MTDEPASPTAARLVQHAGLALYGQAWQSELARLLVVDRRALRRVARAVREGVEHPAARDWLDALAEHLQDRINEMQSVGDAVEKPFIHVRGGERGAAGQPGR